MKVRHSLFGMLLAGALLFVTPGSRAQNPQPVQDRETAMAAPELAQAQPGQAVVTYLNGELTISANNAPLGEILHAVCDKVGAVLELPLGANRRMFAILGPGRPRDVLASLLDNAQLDFVLVASAQDPSALGRVMVFPGTKDSSGGPALVAETEESQPQAAATSADAAPVVPDSGMKQLKELFAAARSDGSSSEKIVLEGQGEDGEEAAGIDPSTILQQLEAKLNSIEGAALQASGSQTNQQAAAPAPINRLPGRHRR